ncbi:MMPL family transporter [Methylomonas montana]|uniref:MMPL family transporter n=1 Tax=Methylomonas montana TaxID=3058963 RepID=UPI002658F0F7|nr:MMPL family transporter [Methylomonas montana]WKJ92569.1 MMPL family transporter [Methylomonas montana]
MSFVWRKRWFILLFPLLLAVTVWQLRVETDLNAFFTATDDEDSRLLSGLLKSGELSRRYMLVVEKAEPANSASETSPTESPLSLAVFSARLLSQFAKLEDVEQVWPADQPPRDWIDAVASYAPYQARIFSLNPEQDGQELFDPAKLAAKAEGLKQALLSPQGSFVKAIAKQDPLLLSLNGFKDLQGQFQQQAKLGDGGALILQSRPAALDSEAHTRLQAAIRASFDSLNSETGGAFRLSMAGVPVFSVAAQSEISQDVTLVSVVSSLAVALVFIFLFHSFSALHWVMMVQGASFVIGTLATALVFQDVHSLTLALGASLIGISSDYPIHVMVHCAKHRNTPLSAVRLLWPSLLMGGLTTVIGYGALGFTGFPGFEQIAVFAVASIAGSLGLTRWVLPALLTHSSLHAAHLPGIGAWVDFCGRHRKLLLGLFGVGVIFAGLSLPQIRWMDDMQNLAMDMDLLKRQDATVRSHFSSIEPGRFVLIQADDWETALQRSEAAERRLKALKQAGVVSEYHGLFPWLVSEQLQTENAKVYQRGLTPEFQQAWKAGLSKAGLSVEKLGTLFPASAEPLQPAAVMDSPVRHILSGQMLAGQNGVMLSLWLGEHDPDQLIEGLAGLEGTRYFSQKDQLDHLAGKYRDRSLVMLGIGIGVMALFIWLQQRDLRKVFLTLLPSVASVLFIFATWALMGEEVSFLHVIGLLLSVSLCVDYGIFFIDNRGRDADVTYHAIASSTLTTIASFGALGLGKTPTLPILALSVSLGVTLGFLLCPLLIQKPTN